MTPYPRARLDFVDGSTPPSRQRLSCADTAAPGRTESSSVLFGYETYRRLRKRGVR